MFFLILFIFSLNSFAAYKMDKIIIDNNFKFCIIGDTGTGTSTQKLIADEMLKESCNQVRILGDIIYPSGLSSVNDKLYYKKFFNPFKKIINSPQKPVFHIITGNHDYKGDHEVWTKLHKKYAYIFSPKMYFTEIYPEGICFYNLDTNPLNRINSLKYAYDEYFWLKNELKENNACHFSVAFGHHPYWTSGKHHDAEFIQKWLLDFLVIGKMKSYFSGHDHHNGFEGTKDKTDFFVSGGFSQLRPLTRPSRGQSFAELGYMVVTFHRDLNEKIFMRTKIKTYRNEKMITVFTKETY